MSVATKAKQNGKVVALPTATTVTEIRAVEPAEETPAWPAHWRSVQKTADKVAILGHSPSTREMAPFDDPTYELWSLNDAHAFVKGRRLTRHFEIHTRNVYRNPERRTAGYMEYLQTFPGPVYMLDPDPTVTSCVLWPKELEAKYGRLTNWQNHLKVEPVFTSGFSYMIAIALEEGFKRIEFYGADLMGEEEYIRQREGFAYFYGVAQGMGVEVILPDACPILRAPLYGQNTTEPAGLTEDEISNALSHARQKQGKAGYENAYWAGYADAWVKIRAQRGK